MTAEDVNELLVLQRRREGRRLRGGRPQRHHRVLASPFFLYRSERVPGGLRPGATYAISDLELASKLSFFLWNSIPMISCCSSRCRQAEYAGRARSQVKRMLADPRSITLASNFVHQWLDMKRLDEIVPDSAVPYASGRSDPRDDFRTELTLFADSIFREDRSAVDLLEANHTFLNERVALHYGITDVKGDRFRRVELPQSVRWGLLGKGAC